MVKKETWRKIAKYGTGVAALTASVGAAWFVPGWYSDWHDSKLLNQVVLSNREDIQFLDVDALDIAGVMKMLKTANYYGYNYLEYSSPNVFRVKQGIKKWEEYGLVPEGVARAASLGALELECSCVVYTSQGSLSVNVTRYRRVEEDCYLTVVMDQDKDLIYYLSFSGQYFSEKIAQTMGYENFSVLVEAAEAGKVREEDAAEAALQMMLKDQRAEYAAPVNAESAEVRINYKNMSGTVDLHFDTFDGIALGNLVDTYDGIGFAVMYGSDLWQKFVSELMASFGSMEEPAAWAESYTDIGVENLETPDRKALIETEKENTNNF